MFVSSGGYYAPRQSSFPCHFNLFFFIRWQVRIFIICHSQNVVPARAVFTELSVTAVTAWPVWFPHSQLNSSGNIDVNMSSRFIYHQGSSQTRLTGQMRVVTFKNLQRLCSSVPSFQAYFTVPEYFLPSGFNVRRLWRCSWARWGHL